MRQVDEFRTSRADHFLHYKKDSMKTWLKTLLISVLTLAGVNLLVSCTQKGGGVPQVGQASPGPVTGSGGTVPAANANGTSDSGGGTGIDGKVFESYIVDPTGLPAYQQFVKPLLENLKSEKPTEPIRYDQIFKMKTWYIAPVELSKISKDLLGVSFINSSTQQIARQTMKEVWIDKRVYDAMEPRDQAELLVHELVMNMYFFKFITMTDMCRVSVLINGEKDNEGCVHSSNLLDKAMPPEKIRPLDDQDNANIRFVTGWLMQNAQKPVPEKDFVRVLFNKGFDKRMFNPDNYGDKGKPAELKISGKELYRAIKGAELTGNMPSVCAGLTSSQTKPCKVEITEKQMSLQGMTLPAYNVGIALEGEAPINMFFYVGDETTLSTSDDGNGGIIYTFVLADWRDKIHIGDRLYSGFMLFRKESPAPQAGLSLDSLIVKPGIIVSMDKTKDPICLVSAPKVVSLIDDGILIQQTNAQSNLVQQSYAAAPPFAACSASNVAE